MKRLYLKINGHVQGVGFRYFVSKLASSMGINGWVRNCSDFVETEVEGSDPMLEKFLERLRKEAPPTSNVTSTDETEIPPKHEQGFTIRPTQH